MGETPIYRLGIWLGYQDLNLGMTGSKPAALPLGDTPIVLAAITLVLPLLISASVVSGYTLGPQSLSTVPVTVPGLQPPRISP